MLWENRRLQWEQNIVQLHCFPKLSQPLHHQHLPFCSKASAFSLAVSGRDMGHPDLSYKRACPVQCLNTSAMKMERNYKVSPVWTYILDKCRYVVWIMIWDWIYWSSFMYATTPRHKVHHYSILSCVFTITPKYGLDIIRVRWPPVVCWDQISRKEVCSNTVGQSPYWHHDGPISLCFFLYTKETKIERSKILLTLHSLSQFVTSFLSIGMKNSVYPKILLDLNGDSGILQWPIGRKMFHKLEIWVLEQIQKQ